MAYKRWLSSFGVKAYTYRHKVFNRDFFQVAELSIQVSASRNDWKRFLENKDNFERLIRYGRIDSWSKKIILDVKAFAMDTTKKPFVASKCKLSQKYLNSDVIHHLWPLGITFLTGLLPASPAF